MQPEDLIRRLEAAFNQRNLRAFIDLYAPDATLEDPLCVEPLTGPAAIRQHINALLTTFPDLRLSASKIIARGSISMCSFGMAGTQLGPLTTLAGVLPPTHKRVEWNGVLIIHANPHGLIMEEQRYYDTGMLVRQLESRDPGLVKAA